MKHSTPSLQLCIHNVDGTATTFVRKSATEASWIPDEFQPARIFCREWVTLTGENFITSFPVSQITRIELTCEQLPHPAFPACQVEGVELTKEQFQALAVKQPQSVPAHTMIGMILQAQHRDDDAIPSYERALKIDPSAPVAANNLAWLYAERGVRLEEALALARAAADRLPDNAEIRDTLGYVHFRRKDPAKAITEFQRCVSKDPKNALFQYHLGIALAATGDRIQARRALEEALRLNPAFDGAAEARQTLESLKG